MAARKAGTKALKANANSSDEANALVAALDSTMKSMYPKSWALLSAPADDALRKRLRAELPKMPDILVELYAWRNGGESFLALENDASAFDWMPLEQAFAERERLAASAELPEGWFPVFKSTDGAFLCVDAEGRLTYFDTQGEEPGVGYDTGIERFDRLERAVAKTLENMRAEQWRFGREAAGESEVEELVATKKKKALGLLAKSAKSTDAKALVKAQELAFEILRVHQRPDVTRTIVEDALPLLPRGIPGATIREQYWSIELEACIKLELESDAALAAHEASTVSGRATYLGQLGKWLFAKGSYGASAEAFGKAASGRNGGDPWLLAVACALTQKGDMQLARDAAKSALAAIDKTLSTLTSERNGTARAGALIRKAVALTLLGDLDAGKKTFVDALTQAEPCSVLQSIKDDPVWADVTGRFS
jgi:hypothetical protein